MITTPALIHALDVITAGETEAARVLLAMTKNGTSALTNDQHRAFHKIADAYGTRALDYVTANKGDRDGSMTSPGMALIQAATHSARDWENYGLPSDGMVPDDLWAVGRAAVAALTWAHVELGHIEAARRLLRAVPTTSQ